MLAAHPMPHLATLHALQPMSRVYLVTMDGHRKFEQSLIAYATHTDLCVFVSEVVKTSIIIDCLFEFGQRQRRLKVAASVLH